MRRSALRRRLPSYALTLALAAGIPAVAAAGKKPPDAKPRDGYLAVEGAKGVIQIAARGSVIGQLDSGRVVVVDPHPFDAVRPKVRGADWRKQRSRTTTVYGGTNLHYRLAGGFFRVKLDGLGIDLSAIGHGSVTLKGDERYADTGLYSLNGGEFTPVPYEQTTLQLAAAPPTG